MSLPSDDQKSAIDFVDILFALVVGSVLDVLTRAGQLTAAARTHLALAGLLTLLSWIGYHNSSHRYNAKITFDPRRPGHLTALGKFLIDVGLVVVYWLAVETTEGGFDKSSKHPSWHATVLLTFLAFVGYALWDLLAWLGPREGSKPRRGLYYAWRRLATILSLGAVLVAGVVTATVDPKSDAGVALVNGILCVVIVAYRVLKDTEPARYRSWYSGQPGSGGSSDQVVAVSEVAGASEPTI